MGSLIDVPLPYLMCPHELLLITLTYQKKYTAKLIVKIVIVITITSIINSHCSAIIIAKWMPKIICCNFLKNQTFEIVYNLKVKAHFMFFKACFKNEKFFYLFVSYYKILYFKLYNLFHI